MTRFISAVAVVVALGAVVLIAFGWQAIWLYAFAAVIVAALVIGTAWGGPLITDWSRRRFEYDRRR